MKGFLLYILEHLRQLHFDLKTSKHALSWALIISMLGASVMGIQYSQLGLQTSVLTLEVPDDFDGTVYPLEATPKWHTLTTAEYHNIYSEIPASKLQAMPRYNPNTLQASLSELGYTDEENAIRDAKITYSVAYLGNYQLDGVEYAGSHPGVDIKAPVGTPVRSIANGVVTKVSNQEYGFGLHVVVKHVNVPTVSGSTQTLYSSYSHLDQILAKEGDVVAKGENIGTVGNTGTSTTPHLHFQLDKGGSVDGSEEAAPWFPYWPFTYNDYAEQGLSFFDAINQGIGQENAIKYSLNPMTFVQSYLVSSGAILSDSAAEEIEVEDIEEVVSTSEETVDDTEVIVEDSTSDIADTEDAVDTHAETPDVIPTEDVVDEAEDTPPVLVEEPVEIPEDTAIATKPNYTLAFDHKDTYLVGNMMEFEVVIQDEEGNLVEEPFFPGIIELSSTDSSIVELKSDTLHRSDFENGKALVKAKAQDKGEFKLRIPFSDSIYESDLVTVRDDVKEMYGFKIEHDGLFAEGVAETLTIIPVDKEGDRTSYTVLGEVTVTLLEGDAVLSSHTLNMSDFSEGIAHIEVVPQSDDDIVVQAAHSFLKGVSEPLKAGAPLFSDLSMDHENYEAIQRLKKRDVISGYPDGTFKPEKGVSRVEALKLIFAGLEAAVPDPEALYFMLEDLFEDQWYAPYVAHAINQGVVKGYPDGTFKPAQTVNKAEFAKMLVLGLNIDMDMNIAEDAPIIGTDVRPTDWFYPYVSFLVENGIIDLIDNKFNPAEPMDRAKVAEAIWRVVKAQ